MQEKHDADGSTYQEGGNSSLVQFQNSLRDHRGSQHSRGHGETRQYHVLIALVHGAGVELVNSVHWVCEASMTGGKVAAQSCAIVCESDSTNMSILASTVNCSLGRSSCELSCEGFVWVKASNFWESTKNTGGEGWPLLSPSVIWESSSWDIAMVVMFAAGCICSVMIVSGMEPEVESTGEDDGE